MDGTFSRSWALCHWDGASAGVEHVSDSVGRDSGTRVPGVVALFRQVLAQLHDLVFDGRFDPAPAASAWQRPDVAVTPIR